MLRVILSSDRQCHGDGVVGDDEARVGRARHFVEAHDAVVVERRVDHAAVWFDACPISENDRVKMGMDNARRLFRLEN